MKTGDLVSCTLGGETVEAIYITERDGMAVLKLSSGYNIGLPPTDVRFIGDAQERKAEEPLIIQDSTLPELSIISTGGTIASRVDYRTGAVTSRSTAEEIIRAIPRMASVGQYRTRQPFSILSENMKPSMWIELARTIYAEIEAGVRGVIITHGTDTMAYSASAVSFMLDTPVPVIFVGSQRSADRPSSDNAMNALCSAAAASADLGEVAICMHGTEHDDFCALHRATRVRKMHTSRRDAFQSIGTEPIATITYPELAVSPAPHAIQRGAQEPVLNDTMEERCALFSYYPGMDPAILDSYASYRGVVIAGTGLGHVGTTLMDGIRQLVRNQTTVVMTTQCLSGRVCDRVYDTGRDLLRAGVIEGEDMLPETALVKLMWVLGQTDEPGEIRKLMQESQKGEIVRRSAYGL
ncbi:Glu-tRNA(Gln) amidotransferase subunit GatD [Methanocalculus taiwanensis]|uniref:Glutamyl-tRNA(Gln) amidotransferase subunit D n=1 Tax=Methanocalculus taiwanensis TaxID=106207 RepID=A0ABD4TLP4_9EURY|nr:Glu-tRNA(Gln) amidotransferase subunit GatD [Methanocalculus taiwanensis]MCQ1538898.1 Glu-tRNA(Gln) amidotransferase subunit GatD [Methanocalculus taiwanensis]